MHGRPLLILNKVGPGSGLRELLQEGVSGPRRPTGKKPSVQLLDITANRLSMVDRAPAVEEHCPWHDVESAAGQRVRKTHAGIQRRQLHYQ